MDMRRFLLKMDRQGNVVDQIKFGRDSLHLTSNYPKIDNFIVDAANNVIFTGQEAETNWPLTNFSALLFKMNSNLELVWRYSNDLAYKISMKSFRIQMVNTGYFRIILSRFKEAPV
ncbi:MAG: hypothetical protein IPH33_04345 [Bacteroidetes bacterium]|nr:hypothetical protein [Bacteroidota bacterium]